MRPVGGLVGGFVRKGFWGWECDVIGFAEGLMIDESRGCNEGTS